MKLRRWLKRTLIAAAVSIAVLISLNLILTAIWSRQIDRKLAELRAAGEPVTLADLVPEPVPDEENAAPMFEKALALLSKEEQSAVGRCFSAADFRQPPSASSDANDGAPTELEPALHSAIAKQSSVMFLVGDALAKSRCVDSLEQSREAYLYSNPASSKLFSLCEYLAVCATVDLREGHVDDAVDSILLGLRLAQPQDAYVTAPQGRLEVVLLALQSVLKRSALTNESAEIIYGALSELDLNSEALRQFRKERVFANEFFDDARRDFSSVVCIDYAPPREGLEPGDRFLYRTLGFFLRPLLCKDQLFFIDASSEELSSLEQPYRVLAKGEKHSPLYARYAGFWLDGGRSQRLRDARKAQIGLAQTALALKTYKNRHGSYPASLKELKTCPGWTLPDDPFSGKPFGYKRIGQGFRVWSWGDDLVDDGGRLDSEISGPGTGGREDMVWIVEK